MNERNSLMGKKPEMELISFLYSLINWWSWDSLSLPKKGQSDHFLTLEML